MSPEGTRVMSYRIPDVVRGDATALLAARRPKTVDISGVGPVEVLEVEP
jgi:hypothetical protein